jgi:hypothetical protein
VDELIPGLPDKIEKPDPNWLPYTSDILRAHENDKGYNEVLRLTQAGVGFNDAVNQVLGMAEEMNYSMPLEMDTGDRIMTMEYGKPVPSITVSEYKAQQAALGEFEDVDEFADLTEEQLASIGYEPPVNIDEGAFRTGASQYVQEFNKQARHQEERDAVVARYADYVAPRYAFNIEQVLEDGYRPYSQNFQATDKSPANQYDDAKGEWAARVAASERQQLMEKYAGVSKSKAASPEGRPAPSSQPTRQGSLPEWFVGAPKPGGRTTEQRRVDSAEAARWAGNTGAVKNKNYTNTFARDQAAAKRSNQANKESNDRIEAHYRRFVEAAREGATIMSKEQQYNKMLSEYLGTVYRGGA